MQNAFITYAQEEKTYIVFQFLTKVIIGRTGNILFVNGNQYTKEFIKYTVELIQKENPKISFLHTATANNTNYTNYRYDLCPDLKIEPKVMKVWADPANQKKLLKIYCSI